MRGDSVAAEAWTHSPCAWPRRTGRDRLRDFIDRVAQGRLRRIVTRVLAIRPRGFVPNDVLHLSKLSAQLQIEWRSRDVHPWDRDVATYRRAELFREQTLHDTEAAILKFFQVLPEIDAIGIRVLEPHAPNRLLLAGTVARHDVLESRSLPSPGMRLKLMGIRFDTREGHLKPLDASER